MAILRTRRSIDGYNFSISQDLCMLSRFRLGSPVYSASPHLLSCWTKKKRSLNVASDDVRSPPPPFFSYSPLILSLCVVFTLSKYCYITIKVIHQNWTVHFPFPYVRPSTNHNKVFRLLFLNFRIGNGQGPDDMNIHTEMCRHIGAPPNSIK